MLLIVGNGLIKLQDRIGKLLEREQILRARQGRIDDRLFAVRQRDVETLVGRPRRDVAAHDTRTDDMHAPDAAVLAA